MSASVGPIRGIGRSCSSIFPGATNTAARIVDAGRGAFRPRSLTMSRRAPRLILDPGGIMAVGRPVGMVMKSSIVFSVRPLHASESSRSIALLFSFRFELSSAEGALTAL
jgi:hypothetical protein